MDALFLLVDRWNNTNHQVPYSLAARIVCDAPKANGRWNAIGPPAAAQVWIIG